MSDAANNNTFISFYANINIAKLGSNCWNRCFVLKPKRLFGCLYVSSQAISFLTPLAVIFVVKIIQRTDRTEIKEACLGM